MTNIALPVKEYPIFLAAEVNSYEPKTPTKCTKNVVFSSKSGKTLVTSLTYSRSGIFLRALLIDYEYFTVNGFYRMGFLSSSLLAPFGVADPKFKKKYLLLLWTTELTELDSLYSTCKGEFLLINSNREATDQYQRIIKLLLLSAK